MYIREIHINNFRSIHELRIPLRHYTVFIGRNNSGKTSIIEAILLLFKILESGYGEEDLNNFDARLREQIEHAMFYKFWNKPIVINGIIALDRSDELIAGDAIKELIKVCGLSEELKYIDVSIYLEKENSTTAENAPSPGAFA